MKVVTSGQMRQIEVRSVKAGVSTDALMENAGLGVAERVRHHLGRLEGVSVALMIGPGNNGGDGLVTARHLHAWGASVSVFLCLQRKADDRNLAIVKSKGVAVYDATTDGGIAQLRETLAQASMVVDAVLGTGHSRPIGRRLGEALRQVTLAKAERPGLTVLALDVPSGLDADTGSVDPECPVADITISLGHPKRGLYEFPGAALAGRVEVEDIGLPAGLDGDVDLELMTHSWARAALPDRPLSAHKGTFGRALLVAGSRNYVGAPYLAAAGALRVGAGLVTLAVPESIQPSVAARTAEPTYVPLPESSPGVLSPQAVERIIESLPNYDALLVGCGMGQAVSTIEMLEKLLYSGARLPPTIVDADGLNFLALSQDHGWWERFSSQAIVTPHPGEMSRLVGSTDQSDVGDRVAAAGDAAAKWGKVVVLKGPFTVVASPGGHAILSPFANPGLATAGTGDILAGVIVGLLAQGLDIGSAAALGVYLHGAAGERVRDQLGDTGMLASDLLPELPRAIKDLRVGG